MNEEAIYLARQAGYIRSIEISKKNMSYNKLMSQINEQTKAPLVIPTQMFGFKWGERTSDPIPMLAVIAGKSGVGKSTLLNLIRYYFNDKDTNKLPFKIELNDPESTALEQLDETCIDLLKVNGNVNLKDPLKLGSLLHNRFSRNKEVNLNCDLYESCLTADDPSKLNFVNHGRIKYLFAGKENQENRLKMNDRLKKKKFKFYLEINADNDNELVFKRLNNPNSSLKLKNLSVKEQLTFFTELHKLNLKSNSSGDQGQAQAQDGDQSVKFMNLGSMLNMIKVNLNADLVTINSQLEAKGFRYLIDLDSYKEILFTEKSSGKKKNSSPDPNSPGAAKKYKLADLAPSEQLIFFEKMAKLFDTPKKSSADSFGNDNLNLLESESFKAKFLGTDGAKNLQKLNEKLKKEKKFPFEIAFEKQVEFVARLRNKPDTKLKLPSLSSTEQLILLSHLWELNRFQFNSHFNKLVMLIDDADLNMHPKDLSDFIRLVIEVLVNQMKIQVILNTNHPTVISYLVKENLNSSCLFEMYEEEDEIKIARDHESSEDMSTIDHYLNKIGIFMPSNYEHLLASTNSSPSPYLTTTTTNNNPNPIQPLSSIVEGKWLTLTQLFVDFGLNSSAPPF